ncbi:MAG TPA: pilus assembly protein PilM [Candidatus Paceibacterota bacterium]
MPTVPKQLEHALQRARSSPLLQKGGVLGIDIGSSSIKIVQLRASLEKPILETYGMIELNAYGADSEKKQAEGAIDKRAVAILDLLQEIGATARRGGMSLPLSSVFVSLIETVKRDEKQLRQIIEKEARAYIPVDLDKVTLVWQIIPEHEDQRGAFAHAEETMTESAHPQKILLAAASNDTLHTYEKIARDAQLTVSFFEAEVFSALRAVPQEKGAPYLFIDIGTSGSKSYIADERGNTLATHYLDVARSASGDTSEMITKTSENALRMVHEYNAAHPKIIGACILSGAGARIPDMAPYIAHKTGLPVMIADPFKEVQTPMILEDTLRDVGPLYTVACGLALRALAGN